MPKVSRSRVVDAPVRDVWRLVADPYHLPRWWPKVLRVEGVSGAGKRMRWTTVMQADSGRPVRADYRATASTEERRWAWSQDLAGTPFDRILRAWEMALELEPEDERHTKVRLLSEQRLRGLSRLGSPMMRSATGRALEEALDGLQTAVGRREEAGS